MEDRIKGSLLVISTSFLYSFIGVFSRFAGISLFTLVFYKVALAAFFFLLIFLIARKDIRKLGMSMETAKFLIPFGFVVAMGETVFIGAYMNTTMTNAVFLNGLAPVFVALLSVLFLGEGVEPHIILSIILGIAGVGFVVGADLPAILGGKDLLGDILGLSSAVTYAFFIIYSRERAKMNMDIYYSVFWSYAIASLFIFPLNLAYGTFAVPPGAVIWIALLAFFCTSLAFLLLCKGFEYIEAAKGSVFALSEQMFVAINAFLFFGEGLTFLTGIGALLICSSVIIAEMEVTQ